MDHNYVMKAARAIDNIALICKTYTYIYIGDIRKTEKKERRRRRRRRGSRSWRIDEGMRGRHSRYLEREEREGVDW